MARCYAILPADGNTIVARLEIHRRAFDLAASGRAADAFLPLKHPVHNDLEFDALLDDYRALELRVGEVMRAVCAPYCGDCPTPCCRIAICREAGESPFLKAVHGSRQAFDMKSGYLGTTGCKLGAGRPPVCHAFICGRIMSRQPGEERPYALEVLGDLVGYLGKGVWMKRHLVEAMTDADLRNADRRKFRSRLETAAAAMDILESYFASGRGLEASERTILGLIRKPLAA